MFNENQHGSKSGGNVEQEAGVRGEPLNVTFIAGVYEDGSSPAPVLGVNEVPLVEDYGAFGGEGEVV